MLCREDTAFIAAAGVVSAVECPMMFYPAAGAGPTRVEGYPEVIFAVAAVVAPAAAVETSAGRQAALPSAFYLLVQASCSSRAVESGHPEMTFP